MIAILLNKAHFLCIFVLYNILSVPARPSFRVESTATTISLYDERSMDSVVDKYVFRWWRDPSVGCSVNHHGNTTAYGTDNTFVIEYLYTNSIYSITVTAINRVGSSELNITAMTQHTGNVNCHRSSI